MRKFEDTTACPYGNLIADLKSSTSEQDRLQMDIFDSIHQHALDGENVSNDDMLATLSP